MTRVAAGGGPKRLADCLPDRLRGALSARVDEDSRLRHAWHARVAEPLASHVRPVRYAAGLLFVHVDTAAWASRLRHERPAVMTALRGSAFFRDLADLRFRVVPRGSSTPPAAARADTAPQPTRLSGRAAEEIGRTAATVTDPALRAALERLAQPGSAARVSKRNR